MLINYFKMESGRVGAMDAKPTTKTDVENDLRPVMSPRCPTVELNSQFIAKQSLNFEQFCKDRVNAVNVSPVYHVSPSSSSSYSSLVSKSIPGTKHTIDAILGLRKTKCQSNHVKTETNCSDRSYESIESNSKSGIYHNN